MRRFNKGEIVWCNTGEPSNETDGSFVGVVDSFIGNLVYVKNFLTQDGSLCHDEDLTPLRHCPIDDDKNLNSDWIYEEFLFHSFFDGSYHYGWIYGTDTGNDATTKKYPLKCNISFSGNLRIEKYDNDDDTFRHAVEIINDLFNCNPNNKVVAGYEVADTIMLVRFYHLVGIE